MKAKSWAALEYTPDGRVILHKKGPQAVCEYWLSQWPKSLLEDGTLRLVPDYEIPKAATPPPPPSRLVQDFKGKQVWTRSYWDEDILVTMRKTPPHGRWSGVVEKKSFGGFSVIRTFFGISTLKDARIRAQEIIHEYRRETAQRLRRCAEATEDGIESAAHP